MIDGPAGQLRFGMFVLDPERCTLLRDGRPVPLRRQSFDTLHHLAERIGQVVSRKQLVSAVWASPPADPDASVIQCIKEIRKALGDDSRWMIRTVPGTGYEFKAVVHVTGATEAVPEPRHEESANARPPDMLSIVGIVGRIRAVARRRRLMGAVALAAVIALPVSVALIWPADVSIPERDAEWESYRYEPPRTIPTGKVVTIRTSDGKMMTCIGGKGQLIRRRCWWNS